MYIIIRKHIIPTDFNVELVYDWYEKSLHANGVLMTTVDMNLKLKKVLSRNSGPFNEETLTIELDDFDVLMKSECSESMDVKWKCIKPSKQNIQAIGKLTWKKTQCPICMTYTSPKITLDKCKCTFHRHCINRELRYRKTCPVCCSSINISEKLVNAT